MMTVFIPHTTPLDEATLRLVESDLKCALPASFRAFVAKHDGAVPQDNIFSTSDNQSGVSRFVPVSEAARLRTGIEGFPDQAIPIAEDDCGNYVWLHPKTGEIFFWDHEIECDGQRIAESFDSFLSMLQPFDPASIKVQPGKVISVWIDPDFKPEFD
jgi:SMI1-KNR4 cell-wall